MIVRLLEAPPPPVHVRQEHQRRFRPQRVRDRAPETHRRVREAAARTGANPRRGDVSDQATTQRQSGRTPPTHNGNQHEVRAAVEYPMST